MVPLTRQFTGSEDEGESGMERMKGRSITTILLSLAALGILATPSMGLVGYETPITSSLSNHTWPSIYGNLVAYEDDRNGTVDIYLYNLSSGIEKRLTSDPSPVVHYWPKIYGDRVVWWDNRTGNFDVYLYNTTTNLVTQITKETHSQENADLYGDRIVYMDDRSGNFDVYLYNTTTNLETQITSDTAAQWEPQIWGDHIVWMDNRSNPGTIPASISIITPMTSPPGPRNPLPQTGGHGMVASTETASYGPSGAPIQCTREAITSRSTSTTSRPGPKPGSPPMPRTTGTRRSTVTASSGRMTGTVRIRTGISTSSILQPGLKNR